MYCALSPVTFLGLLFLPAARGAPAEPLAAVGISGKAATLVLLEELDVAAYKLGKAGTRSACLGSKIVFCSIE